MNVSLLQGRGLCMSNRSDLLYSSQWPHI